MPLLQGHFYLQFTLTISCAAKAELFRFIANNRNFWHNYRKE